MRKRLLPLLCLAVLSLMWFRPSAAHAEAPDPNAKASLTLHYQKEETAFSDLSIGIYRVAQGFSDGTFELIEPFASYPVNIHGITQQDQWNTVAQTLYAYAVADQVEPDRTGKTDATGTVRFSDLETGLYLVQETVAENTDGTYLFNRFMVYLPTPDQDGTYNYDVEAKPKCVDFIPKTQYTVTKLWQDAGMQHLRPKEVTVDIYQDGVLQDTQVLSAHNNWTYTWSVSRDDPGKWTVVERNVPDDYKVTVQQNGSNFSILNACPTKPEPPKTGDTFSPMPWILTMCFAGILLVALGIYGRRHQ